MNMNDSGRAEKNVWLIHGRKRSPGGVIPSLGQIPVESGILKLQNQYDTKEVLGICSVPKAQGGPWSR